MVSFKTLGFSLAMALMPSMAFADNQEPLPLKENQQIIEERGHKVAEKAQVLNATFQEVQGLQTKKQILAKQLDDGKKTIEDLRKKIADKKAAQVAPTPAPSAPISVSGSCGDNQYAAFIYGMESGGRVVGNCNPTAQNSGGCLGIGQACPGAKLLAVCPGLDYACQNAFFTNYALSRYGSWAGAYQFWVAHNWW